MKKKLIIPIIIALAPVIYANVFAIYPFLMLIYYSFHSYVFGKRPIFCGLYNYVRLFNDPVFLHSCYITGIYTLTTVTTEFILGLFIAYLLYKIKFGKGTFMTLILIPMIMTPAVSGIIWKILFDPAYGHINFYLSILGFPRLKWLLQPVLALISAMIVDIWQWTPFMVLSIFAGFSAVPKDIIEAAYTDGAPERAILKDIMVPYIKPLILIILLLRTIDSLKVFDTIFTLTRGGPGFETMVMSVLDYVTLFAYYDIGRAASIGVILWILCFMIGLFFMRKYGVVVWG